MVSIFIPILTVSESNTRCSPWDRAKRMKAHRRAARLCAATLVDRKAPTERWIVLLTRFGRKRLDGDNLGGCLKGVRDGVADAIGIDDGDPRIRRLYDQRIVTRESEIGVEVAIEQRRTE